MKTTVSKRPVGGDASAEAHTLDGDQSEGGLGMIRPHQPRVIHQGFTAAAGICQLRDFGTRLRVITLRYRVAPAKFLFLAGHDGEGEAKTTGRKARQLGVQRM